MAITPRTFTDRLGAPSVETLVPREEHTASHFFGVGGPVHPDIQTGGQAGVPILGPWRETTEGHHLVIVGNSEQRGTLRVEESENGTAPASGLELGVLGNGYRLGARVAVSMPFYRVTFTPALPCDRVLIESQSRP